MAGETALKTHSSSKGLPPKTGKEASNKEDSFKNKKASGRLRTMTDEKAWKKEESFMGIPRKRSNKILLKSIEMVVNGVMHLFHPQKKESRKVYATSKPLL